MTNVLNATLLGQDFKLIVAKPSRLDFVFTGTFYGLSADACMFDEVKYDGSNLCKRGKQLNNVIILINPSRLPRSLRIICRK